jgi:hypothetical protein
MLNELGAGIAESTNGRVFVTGWFLSFSEFGGEALTCAGADDAFVVALAPFGRALGARSPFASKASSP